MGDYRHLSWDFLFIHKDTSPSIGVDDNFRYGGFTDGFVWMSINAVQGNECFVLVHLTDKGKPVSSNWKYPVFMLDQNNVRLEFVDLVN